MSVFSVQTMIGIMYSIQPTAQPTTAMPANSIFQPHLSDKNGLSDLYHPRINARRNVGHFKFKHSALRSVHGER